MCLGTFSFQDATYSGHVASFIETPEKGSIIETAVAYLRGYDGGPCKCQEPTRTVQMAEKKITLNYPEHPEYYSHAEL